MKHYSVLQSEILETFKGLGSFENPILVDCTLGYGGHSIHLLNAYPHLRIESFDRDTQAINLVKARLTQEGITKERIHFHPTPFSQALPSLSPQTLSEVKGIVADLGVSSMQLDEEERGFGFHSSSLDMRMDTQQNLNAAKILNTYSPSALEEIFRNYGEFRESKKLTNLIAERRKKKPFDSCLELSSFIEQHFKNHRIHPATLAFQALRIEVNNELGELQGLLDSILWAYNAGYLQGARVGIISFHSLEDRLIKQAFKLWSKSCICPQENYKCECGNNHQKGYVVTKKPIVPNSNEIAQNKRARSAKLRIFEFMPSKLSNSSM